MEYNSQKEMLIMPEYGRNVQMMVDYCRKIEDPEMRQAVAERIIDLMHQMNPSNKSLDDFKAKLWRHLFRIADFNLDVTSPTNEIPTREAALRTPDPLKYPTPNSNFRHYGFHIQLLVNKAVNMEDPEKKVEFIKVIASYMKLAYRTWNKEQYVSDEVIKSDLKALSDGRLELPEGYTIDNFSGSHAHHAAANSGSNKKRRRNSNSNQNYKSNRSKNKRRK